VVAGVDEAEDDVVDAVGGGVLCGWELVTSLLMTKIEGKNAGRQD
jgi:hypothetical protein